MTIKDPSKELKKAYCGLLKNSIVYEGKIIPVGTIIDKDDLYVLIYRVTIADYNSIPGDIIYEATVIILIVSMQDTTEGDEEIVDSISEQVVELLSDPEAFLMNGFKCLTSMPTTMNPDDELTDANYIILKEIHNKNILQQLT